MCDPWAPYLVGLLFIAFIAIASYYTNRELQQLRRSRDALIERVRFLEAQAAR